MKSARQWIITGSFALSALGFLIPMWPLSAIGICLAAFSSYWIFALGVGLLLDIAWGAPSGFLHYIFFPFTLLALTAALARVLADKYLFKKAPQETL